MNTTQLLGLVAGSFTTIAFLPQVLKTWRSRSAKDLSLGMFSFFCLGVAMWLAYGILVINRIGLANTQILNGKAAIIVGYRE